MLSRVCGALLACPKVTRIVILAQEPERLLQGDAAELADEKRVALVASGDGIATSIAAIAGTKDAPWPILVTTADHALLTPAMVNEFLDGVGDSDLAFAVGERARLEAEYPLANRTWLKFADGHFSGANLFGLRGASTLQTLTLWSGIEQNRKRAFSILSSFGPRLLFRALTRSISFTEAVRRAGARLNTNAKPIVMSQPEAAIDVDKVSDVKVAEAILLSRSLEPAPICTANSSGAFNQ